MTALLEEASEALPCLRCVEVSIRGELTKQVLVQLEQQANKRSKIVFSLFWAPTLGQIFAARVQKRAGKGQPPRWAFKHLEFCYKAAHVRTSIVTTCGNPLT